jgi:hypothetical protein
MNKKEEKVSAVPFEHKEDARIIKKEKNRIKKERAEREKEEALKEALEDIDDATYSLLKKLK